MENNAISVTVFTPTYNRANTLNIVFESLMAQTMRDFEWLVVDDGSLDNTREVMEVFQKRADFPVRYIWQENNGKHIARNHAVMEAKGKFFATVDSDDSLFPNALETLLAHWETIPDDQKPCFRGVVCRSYDVQRGRVWGETGTWEYVDTHELDAVFKYRFRFDMWGINRTDVLREFLNPEIMGGQKTGLRFFPEVIIYNRIGKKYLARYINICLYNYNKDDQENACTQKHTKRYRENYHLWLHYINEAFGYFFYDPARFIKSFVGLARDGIYCNMRLKQMLSQINGLHKRILFLFFYPAGGLLHFWESRKG